MNGRPGLLQSMGSQRVGHNWATKLNWVNSPQRILLCCKLVLFFSFFLFCLKGSSSAVLCIWLISLRVWISKVHPSGDQWHNFIISVVLFCGWVIVPVVCARTHTHTYIYSTSCVSSQLSGAILWFCVLATVVATVNAGVPLSFWRLVSLG